VPRELMWTNWTIQPSQASKFRAFALVFVGWQD
jgi:hypothetical protein